MEPDQAERKELKKRADSCSRVLDCSMLGGALVGLLFARLRPVFKVRAALTASRAARS
jgi:hypothetical protein